MHFKCLNVGVISLLYHLLYIGKPVITGSEFRTFCVVYFNRKSCWTLCDSCMGITPHVPAQLGTLFDCCKQKKHFLNDRMLVTSLRGKYTSVGV